MAVLLVLVAILTVHVTEADYECRSAAAGTGGDCVRVDIGDTHCSLLNFNEMKVSRETGRSILTLSITHRPVAVRVIQANQNAIVSLPTGIPERIPLQLDLINLP